MKSLLTDISIEICLRKLNNPGIPKGIHAVDFLIWRKSVILKMLNRDN